MLTNFTYPMFNKDISKREVNQNGEKSIYAENIGELIVEIKGETKFSTDDLLLNLKSASVDLSSYKNKFGNNLHIVREETNDLFDWIVNDLKEGSLPVAVLAGNAGYGKSVILRDLYDRLVEESITVLGIKADRLTVHSLTEFTDKLQLSDNIETIFNSLNVDNQRVVLLVDQIDALSQSLSSNREPIETYHRLISRLSLITNVRIIVSCRIYDLKYDPRLQEYKNETIFNVSLLSNEQVDLVLKTVNISLPERALKLKEFLRIPLHLQLFCIIDKPENFTETITLQSLYDFIWDDYILTKPSQNKIDSHKVLQLIKEISDEMYNRQQIFLNKKMFVKNYKNELEYLSHHELITNHGNGNIQFMHQSFFDYAYARSFIESGASLSESLKEQHQGLFIRSKVKQVFTYLRDYDHDLYINELENVLMSDDYRFHLKLLLINDLGFYSDPSNEEKCFVKDKLYKESILFQLFIESVNSVEWFKFIKNNIQWKSFFERNDNEFINAIFGVWRRVINESPECVISFLKEIPIVFVNRNTLIGRILTCLSKENIECSIELFTETNTEWDNYDRYLYLKILTYKNSKFVIDILKKELLKALDERNDDNSEYIPGGHDSSEVYRELFKNHQALSIPFFIDIIIAITEKSSWKETNLQYRFMQCWAYYMYVSFESNEDHLHHEIYNNVLKFLDTKVKENLDEAKSIIMPLLESKYSAIVNIPVTSFVNYPEVFIQEIFELFSTELFFIRYLDGDKLFRYNIRVLLGKAYLYFTDEQQSIINERILRAIPDHEKKNLYGSRGVTKYGYTRVFYNAYKLISMIPENCRKVHYSIDKFYKEQYRKYGIIDNEPPRGMQISGIGAPLTEKAYDNMTFEEWKLSFRKYNTDKHYFDGKGSKLEHCRTFEKRVAEDPSKYFNLIDEIIYDKSISISYSVYGLQGLKEANYIPEETKKLFIKLIKKRRSELNDEDLLYLVWLISFFIKESIIDRSLIDFLKDLTLNYEDGESRNGDPLIYGINRVRGAAANKLVECYSHKEFEEDIFTTLETVADVAAVHTRASILQRLALLNNLDCDRNLNLFLKLMHDFNPDLLKQPLHNLHPLVYLINVDFEKLNEFFLRAIECEECHKPISHILFIAWLHNRKGSEELLLKVLDDSVQAKKTVIKESFNTINNSEYKIKCWAIINKYLNEEDKEIGKTYDYGFLKLKEEPSEELVKFIENYIQSPVGKYRNIHFYKYLLKISKDKPEKCIKWSQSFNYNDNTEPKNFYHNEPIQVVIHSYNAIKNFNKKDPILEKAMDSFDSMLKMRENRGAIVDLLHNLDA